MTNIHKLKTHILSRLEKELSPFLTYHNLAHTKDVLESALLIAEHENISDYETNLLIAAVLFHDLGFIYQTKNHEDKSSEIARETLPEFGFSVEEIDRICKMIMATKIPQSPNLKLEEIICDADLDYLGRKDFWSIGDNLFQELKHLEILKTDNEWNELQIKFLESHHYFTSYSKRNRESVKLNYIEQIKNKLT